MVMMMIMVMTVTVIAVVVMMTAVGGVMWCRGDAYCGDEIDDTTKTAVMTMMCWYCC